MSDFHRTILSADQIGTDLGLLRFDHVQQFILHRLCGMIAETDVNSIIGLADPSAQEKCGGFRRFHSAPFRALGTRCFWI